MLRHGCQSERIRGTEKEGLLYRGGNGLWGQSVGAQLGTKVMILCTGTTALWEPQIL